MTKAVLVTFHQYTPWGDEYYRPLFDLFIKNYREIWGREVDKLYILASNWNVDYADDYTIIPTDPQLRYFDAYKQVLKEGLIKEDLVMFMDNDMVVYREGIVASTFEWLEEDKCDVVSIIDEIGTYKTDKLKNGNKFCPYWFAAKKEVLMKYLDVNWGPDMPYCETLGHLTEAMLKDGLRPIEWMEDKSNCLFSIEDDEKGKDLGYYHIRAGSTPAYLLATKHYGDSKTYWDYLKNQPQNEYLRQCAWYEYMGGDPTIILLNAGIDMGAWSAYMDRFTEYYGL